jgi:hypothetical protein
MAAAPPQFDPRVPATDAPIYAIDPVTAAATLVTSVDVTPSGYCARQLAGPPVVGAGIDNGHPSAGYASCSDSSFFSFDVFRGGLWTMGRDSSSEDVAPGFLTLDGAWRRLSCLDSAPIAAVAGGDGYLYIQSEDDVTVYRINSSDCSVVGGFSHPFNGENASETEQIACDPLSFGVPTIWVRNSTAGEIAAYPAPEAVCPFPTKLAYVPATVAKPGAPVDLCFTLSGNLDGRWDKLPGQPVTVMVSGSSVGQAVTNQSGQACVATTAPFSGGAVRVQGKFAGTNAWLPSSADGSFLVPATNPVYTTIGFGLLPPPSLGGLPAPQPGTAPQPNSAPGSEPAGSASVQTEAQAQAQSQSQAQAQSVAQVQPGVMVQRQKRTQVATQEQSVGAQTAYQSSALRRTKSSPVVAVAMGLMMLGLGLVARRPRWALARRHRRE